MILVKIREDRVADDDLAMLTVQETAEVLRLGVNTTYILISRGVLPSVKIGGSRRILRRDLEAFVQQERERS
jgi:excisionase family DNA binding protein